jgi:hypothetical protein
MRYGKIFAACVVALALLPAIPASADVGLRAEGGGQYVGAALSLSGLALTDETPLRELEALDPGSTVSSGGGRDRKNPMIAMLLSCVVPGWGEIYAGESTRGRWFIASEVAIWSGYGTFRVQEELRIDDYEEFAQLFSGAGDASGSDYLSHMGDYIRSEGDNSYNESIRSEARSLFPDDLEAQAAYLAENGYFGDLAWDWGSRDTFYEYRDLREAASRADRHAFYMTGLAILNRAISAIDSAWMARRYNAGMSGEPGARFSVAPLVSEGDVGARATLEVSF